jgi:hypothetical protein
VIAQAMKTSAMWRAAAFMANLPVGRRLPAARRGLVRLTLGGGPNRPSTGR